MRNPKANVCANCGNGQWLYQDGRGAHCRICGPAHRVVSLQDWRESHRGQTAEPREIDIVEARIQLLQKDIASAIRRRITDIEDPAEAYEIAFRGLAAGLGCCAALAEHRDGTAGDKGPHAATFAAILSEIRAELLGPKAETPS